MVVINPVLVIGLLLQPLINFSTAHILKYLTGGETYAKAVQAYIHIRDVADDIFLSLRVLPQKEGISVSRACFIVERW